MKAAFSFFRIVAGLAVCLFAGAREASAQTPVIPDALKVPATETLAFTAQAKGVQIYECRARKEDPTQFEWVFKAPEAELFDAHGAKIGRHYAGPTWESTDGSKVVGELKAHAPSPNADAVSWLLVAAKSHENTGVFSQVTSIQRLNTSGGKALAGGCDQANVGKELRVPYTAVYYFYTSKP